MECTVCFSDWMSEEIVPVVMPCGHTLCMQCVQRAPSPLRCPICLTPCNTPLGDLPKNHLLIELIRDARATLFGNVWPSPAPSHQQQPLESIQPEINISSASGDVNSSGFLHAIMQANGLAPPSQRQESSRAVLRPTSSPLSVAGQENRGPTPSPGGTGSREITTGQQQEIKIFLCKSNSHVWPLRVSNGQTMRSAVAANRDVYRAGLLMNDRLPLDRCVPPNFLEQNELVLKSNPQVIIDPDQPVGQYRLQSGSFVLAMRRR